VLYGVIALPGGEGVVVLHQYSIQMRINPPLSILQSSMKPPLLPCTQGVVVLHGEDGIRTALVPALRIAYRQNNLCHMS
jgi:hypothetical protein